MLPNKTTRACPRCGTQSLHMQLHLFDERFSEKSKDSDLSYFISKYLKTVSPSCEAEPFKWFPSDIEVDVHIKDRDIGIEYKTFIRELTIGEPDVKGKTGELMKKIE